jgi:CheY-like chemotaxis protein
MSGTILLVEDSEDNRGLIRQLVEDMLELPLVEAGDGAAGVRLAGELLPALILMDLSLPVMDGWEATARLKADPATRHIPVVALTAHAMAGDEHRAREAGCDAFITKPVDLDELALVIQGYMAEA